ncbi:MAG: helicase-exonuclease AddAB subunit AddA [Candidatus Flemingibacterium sp.]|nr:helicase-exonuclease AddAB subunit AddA [Candidatus Flemingibacterium sp.]
MAQKRIWTKAQSEAISDRGHDLLVSAGAGSGKTAVLTERIIRRLTDRDNPLDITRMLIVTFTKAAASELKERISSALSDAAAENPSDRRLTRQLFALERAQICTIHSFCLDLLRENFSNVGLRADFRIADDAEIKLLESGLMNELIEDCYSGNIENGYEIADFEDLADSLTGTKGDKGLADIFLSIKHDLESYAEGTDFILNFASELEDDSTRDFAFSRCGREILNLTENTLSVYRDLFADAAEEVSGDEKLAKALKPAFEADVEFIDRVSVLSSTDDFQGLCEWFDGYSPVRFGVARGVALSPEVEAAKKARDEFKKERQRLADKFFSLGEEEVKKTQTDTAKVLRQIHTLLSLFEKRFDEEKRRRGIVDFADLERLASKLLIKDGQPTAAALTISGRYDEIYIDEYQDVNSLQDAIFRSISGNNRFMVGDVKQSIYAFRGADPSIFESYRSGFSRTAEGAENGRTIFLSDNFRCDEPVIRFTNLVSSRLFTNGTGALPYYPDDDLVHSKKGEETGEPVKIALISSETEDEDISEREAEYVAGEIKRLVGSAKKDDGSPITYSDIAILMRSARAQSDVFSTVFKRHGIPLFNSTEGDLFENPEVLLALCLLNVIDNPSRDIYLAGLLKSPVFGFTLDELIRIRRHSSDGSLYDALRAYTDDTGFIKGSSFLEKLSLWRHKAGTLPVDRLVWYLYRDTDLPALVQTDPGQTKLRLANLTMFYEYARSFEKSSSHGLYNFIRYINDIIENKARLSVPSASSAGTGAVRLMTIHQSKGLEFPVVFLCGTGKKFNENDLRQSIVSDRGLGIALKLSDSTGFARYDTPVRQAIAKRLGDSQLEEEMRVLYVALTRARERLYVTGTASEKALDEADSDSVRLSKGTVMKNGGYLRWILLAAANYERFSHPDSLPYRIEIVSPQGDNVAEEAEDIVQDTDTRTEKAPEITDAEYDRMLCERFDYTYPHMAAARLPAKLSVSELFPELLDEDAATLDEGIFSGTLEPHRVDHPSPAPDDSAKPDDTRKSAFRRAPLFLSDKAATESTAAERGTATHLFMQFCDYSRFRPGDDLDKTLDIVQDECARLGENRFITPRIASLVDTRRAALFFTGKLFAEISSSPMVRRETRFNVKLPAADFTSSEELKKALEGETILVQGVMDCFYENKDGSLTIVDYKTDFIPKGMSREDAERMLVGRHRLQLTYYRSALEKISGRKVERVVIYSFGLGREVEVK